jgi:hypothetical protein
MLRVIEPTSPLSIGSYILAPFSAAAGATAAVELLGMASARDPEYTVVPQRERLAARQAGQQVSSTGQASTITR